MRKEQVEKLKLGLSVIDDRTVIIVESALQWINKNTNLHIDYHADDEKFYEEVEANVKLFIIKYLELMEVNPTIASESLGGMSQSFKSFDKSELLRQYADELFGSESSTSSQMSFISAKRRWSR